MQGCILAKLRLQIVTRFLPCRRCRFLPALLIQRHEKAAIGTVCLWLVRLASLPTEAYVQPLLEGHAKAMVVVGSRLEAVRWQLAMQKYIQSRGYRLSALVAFSGEVNDKASGEDPFTENSQVLNPNLRGRDIREAFKTDEYQILLVANKFQTGFDQPLLCGMYVDKRLGGIQAVQTLSRLNRAYSGTFGTKDTTYVLDFVNEAEEVLEAFRTYYTTATLEDVTDPNLVYNLRAKLDAAGHYDEFEVDRVAAVELNPQSKQERFSARSGAGGG